MNIRPLLIYGVLLTGQICAVAQQLEPSPSTTMNLQQAVELALTHNHVVRIASLKVEEDEHAKEVARSAYLPTIRNDSVFAHLTDTQFVGIPAGSLGVVAVAQSLPVHWFSAREGKPSRPAARV